MSVGDSDNDESTQKRRPHETRNDFAEQIDVGRSTDKHRLHVRPAAAATCRVGRNAGADFAEEQVRYGYLKGTKDIWCRDYMPVQIDVGKYVRFRYLPDYLRGKYEHLITDIGTVQGLPFEPNEMTTTDLLVDGGNVVHRTRHTCMTDKIYRENPAVNREILRGELESLLGVEVIVVPKEPFDVIGHTDGVLRFVDESKVIVNDYRDVSLSYHDRLVKKLTGSGLQTILVPYKPSKEKADLESAWGTPSTSSRSVNSFCSRHTKSPRTKMPKRCYKKHSQTQS